MPAVRAMRGGYERFLRTTPSRSDLGLPPNRRVRASRPGFARVPRDRDDNPSFAEMTGRPAFRCRRTTACALPGAVTTRSPPAFVRCGSRRQRQTAAVARHLLNRVRYSAQAPGWSGPGFRIAPSKPRSGAMRLPLPLRRLCRIAAPGACVFKAPLAEPPTVVTRWHGPSCRL